MNRKGLVKALLPRVKKEDYSRVRAGGCILLDERFPEDKLYRGARTGLAHARKKNGAD